RPDQLGVLGKAEEGEPFTVARADEPVRLGLLKEGEESGCLLQIFRHDVTQCRDSRCEILVLVLLFDTRGRSAGGECCGIKRGRLWGEVRRWSGVQVLRMMYCVIVFI